MNTEQVAGLLARLLEEKRYEQQNIGAEPRIDTIAATGSGVTFSFTDGTRFRATVKGGPR